MSTRSPRAPPSSEPGRTAVFVDHDTSFDTLDPGAVGRAELYQWYLYCVAKIQAIDAGLNWYGYGDGFVPAWGFDHLYGTARDLCNRALEAEQRVFSLAPDVRDGGHGRVPGGSGGGTGPHAAGRGQGEGRATGREQYARPGPVPVHRPASRRPGQEERGAGGRGAGHHRGGGRRRRGGGHRLIRGKPPCPLPRRAWGPPRDRWPHSRET